MKVELVSFPGRFHGPVGERGISFEIRVEAANNWQYCLPGNNTLTKR